MPPVAQLQTISENGIEICHWWRNWRPVWKTVSNCATGGAIEDRCMKTVSNLPTGAGSGTWSKWAFKRCGMLYNSIYPCYYHILSSLYFERCIQDTFCPYNYFLLGPVVISCGGNVSYLEYTYQEKCSSVTNLLKRKYINWHGLRIGHISLPKLRNVKCVIFLLFL